MLKIVFQKKTNFKFYKDAMFSMIFTLESIGLHAETQFCNFFKTNGQGVEDV